MEPVEAKITGIRFMITLGKMRVIGVDKGALGQRVKVELFGQPVSATFEAPSDADIRIGDLLTAYTEVLTDANADKPQKH